MTPEELSCHHFLLKLTLTFPLKLEASISPVINVNTSTRCCSHSLEWFKLFPFYIGLNIVDRGAWVPTVAPQYTLIIRTTEVVDEPSLSLS